MSKMMTIVKKELYRVFSDKKLLLQSVFFPGIMIYLIYTLMGSALFSKPDSETITIRAVAQNAPTELLHSFESAGFAFTEFENFEEQRQLVKDGLLEVLVIFPENYNQAITTQDTVANVEIYYNSSSETSSMAYGVLENYLNRAEERLFNVITINNDASKQFDLVTSQDITGMMLGMLIPLLTIMFIVTGALAFAPDAIAGEKERGTISTLLITPIKRLDLALGKVISLSIMASLAATSSLIGVILSLPNLMQGVEFSFSSYGLMDLGLLVILILSFIPVISTLMLIISAYSKNTKEATTALSPVLLLAIGGGILPQALGGSAALYTAFIPVYNVGALLSDLVTQSVSVNYFALTVGSNLVYAAGLLVVLYKMINSERWMLPN